jgi:hypothetical protein
MRIYKFAIDICASGSPELSGWIGRFAVSFELVLASFQYALGLALFLALKASAVAGGQQRQIETDVHLAKHRPTATDFYI